MHMTHTFLCFVMVDENGIRFDVTDWRIGAWYEAKCNNLTELRFDYHL